VHGAPDGSAEVFQRVAYGQNGSLILSLLSHPFRLDKVDKENISNCAD
jgi:hypothetical protein